MKKLLFRLSTAVLAFVVSLYGIYAFDFLVQVPKVEVSDKNIYGIFTESLNSDLEIQYQYTLAAKDERKGVFIVTNRADKTVYYVSDVKNEHADNWIRQHNELTTDLICHIGMREYELKPNESMTFLISVPKNQKPFEAGFKFYVGKDRNSLMIWRRVKGQTVFVGKSALWQ